MSTVLPPRRTLWHETGVQVLFLVGVPEEDSGLPILCYLSLVDGDEGIENHQHEAAFTMHDAGDVPREQVRVELIDDDVEPRWLSASCK